MFEKRSMVLFTCCVLSTAYAVYLISYFGSAIVSTDMEEAFAGVIASSLVTPHIVMISLGSIFCWLSFFLKEAWGALVGAILFCIAALVFLLYFGFCVPLIILGFIAFSNQKKIMEKDL